MLKKKKGIIKNYEKYYVVRYSNGKEDFKIKIHYSLSRHKKKLTTFLSGTNSGGRYVFRLL